MTATLAVARETFAGLASPKRLLPALVVGSSLVVAESAFSQNVEAVVIAASTCVAFLLTAPLAYRLLFPEDGAPYLAARFAAYLSLAVVVNVVLEMGAPWALGVRWTFLGQGVSVLVSVALFVVGGWGLGRDIAFEASLRRERARAEAFAKEAEVAQLLALRTHFDPHFLFNTLNAIAEWCREDGETAERAILALSSMLREVLRGVRAPSWPLERELGLVDALFSLHAIRDPLAFTIERAVDPQATALPIVPLLLLPLAENAVKHGPASGHRGVIRVSARSDGGALAIEIENPGRYGGPRPGSDGLPLVERRLAAAYGADARFAIGAAPAGEGTEPERTRVTLTIPASGPSAGVSV